MASERPGEQAVSLELPESLRGWLDDKAREENQSREEVLLQLLTAYRKLDGTQGAGMLYVDGELTVESLDPSVEALVDQLRGDIETVVDDRLQEYEAETGELEKHVESYLEEHLAAHLDEATASDSFDDRLDEVRAEFTKLLDDVRERVVQVKRETDAKAPADHGHAELTAKVDSLQGEVSAVKEYITRVESQMDDGFDNFEEVLEYLTESIDELSRRQTTLARALVETRDELRKLSGLDSARAAAEDLQRTANRRGIRKATCEECGNAVVLGLLGRPECPHCSSNFVGVEPASGFFGSATLETGRQPALEPSADDASGGFEFGVDEIIEADSPAESDAAEPDSENQ